MCPDAQTWRALFSRLPVDSARGQLPETFPRLRRAFLTKGTHEGAHVVQLSAMSAAPYRCSIT